MQNSNETSREAPIFHKTVDLYKELYEYLKMFPKKDQYLLGRHMEDAILFFMEQIILSASASRERKMVLLQSASGKFDVLKALIRVARELKMLDNKKYISIESKIQEVGRMLGGWIKSLGIKTP